MTGGMLLFYTSTVVLGVVSLAFFIGLYGHKQERIKKIQAKKAFFASDVGEQKQVTITLSRDERLSLMLFDEFGIDALQKSEKKQLKSLLAKMRSDK